MKTYQEKESAQQIPQYVLATARKRRAHLHREMEQAKKRIPAEYHDFLVCLPQNEKIGNGLSNTSYTIGQEGYDLGIYYSEKNNAFYMSIEKPYVTVDGRLKMFRDEHEKANKQFTVHPPLIVPFNEGLTAMSVTIDSEIYGSATGLIEIGFKGGVDSSNPLSNAQTSAIGRALGFLGYGLLGTGLGEEEPKSTSNSSTSNEQNHNRHNEQNNDIIYSFAIENVQPNPDGSATATGIQQNGSKFKVHFPYEAQSFVASLKDHDVIQVPGKYNQEKAILVVNRNENWRVLK